MVMAVICGYMTARFIIAPPLGYDTESSEAGLSIKATSFLDRGEADESDSGADSDDADSDEADSGDSDEDSGGDDAEESDDENVDDADKTASGEGTAESDSGSRAVRSLYHEGQRGRWWTIWTPTASMRRSGKSMENTR